MSRGLSRRSSSTTPPTPHIRVSRHVARLVTWLVVNYFTYVARLGASARRAARHAARRRLLHLRRTSGCFGMLRCLSRDSSSTTSPRTGSSSITSPTPCVRVPWHVARLVTRLVVDYFTYVVRPVASARCMACRVTHRRLLHLAQARCRLLRQRHAFGCLGTSRGSSRGSSSTTSPSARSSSTTSPPPRVRVPRHVTRLVVDYFNYVALPGASACRAARHAAHRIARRQLLYLRLASGCFGMSRGLSRYSSSTTSPRTGLPSTTSPTSRIRVPRHVARLVTRLIVDYIVYAARPGASARRAAHHATRHAARR
jgi:hypothetical protein